MNPEGGAGGERIGVFGGTFDPPHIGHLILAAEALSQLNLERLLWVLTPNPPHKRGQFITPLAVRLEMVVAAIRDDPAFELSRVDLDRPGPHYAVDTVRLLRAQYPGKGIVYLMGGDSLRDLPGWHAPESFLAECAGLGVMRRPGDRVNLGGLEARLPGISLRVEFVSAPLLEISSSQVRERVRSGKPYRYYLPRGVYEIVQRKGLYTGA